jgi:CRP-like cAMP-binding protein
VQPTTQDREVYAAAMRRVAPLTDAAVREGLALVHVRLLPRGAYLLRGGERAHELAVVVSGLLREHFLLADGTERTKAFITEGEVSGSLADLISGAPSRAYIVADEPVRLLVGDFTGSEALVARHTEWRALRTALTERLLGIKAEREYELLGLDAEARYERFRERYPGLEARVAAKHVASYLGVTPVHLSRLRRRQRERGRAASR